MRLDLIFEFQPVVKILTKFLAENNFFSDLNLYFQPVVSILASS